MTVLGLTPNFGFKLIDYRTNPWNELEYDNWRALDSILSTFFALTAIRGVWENSTAYAEGDKTVDAETGALYECVIAHTSAASPTTFAQDRSSNPTFWETVGSSSSFFGDFSVTNYGAAGNGTTDDTQAFKDALAELDAVFVPAGTYKLTDDLILGEGQMLFGVGDSSVLQFRSSALNKAGAATYNAAHDGLVFNGSYITVADLTIVGANNAIHLVHDDEPVVANMVRNVNIWDAVNGIVLDGGTNTNYPCYWNEFHNVRVLRPRDNGVKLFRTGAGDTPNANKFRHVRVYSLGTAMVNDRYGFNVEDGRYANAFVDCEANLATNAVACMYFGADTGGNYVVNFVAECLGGANGIALHADAGQDANGGAMLFSNYFHTTAGSSIYDPGGNKRYYAFFAGFPDRFRLGQTVITKAKIEELLPESEFIDESTDQTLPDAKTVILLSSNGGAYNFDLPDPADAVGRLLFIAKIDTTDNEITIRREDDTNSGPGNYNYKLVKENDFIITYSNGAEWFILGGNHIRFGTDFLDTTVVGTSISNIDPNVAMTLISAGAGNTTVALPAASATQAVGKITTIKKNDSTGNTITVSTIEGGSVVLSTQYDYVTIMSNGSTWFILSQSVNKLPNNFHDASVSGDTYTLNGNIEFHLVSADSDQCDVVIPEPSLANGRRIIVKRNNSSGGNVLVKRAATSAAEGLNYRLDTQFASVTLVSNGAAWYEVGTTGTVTGV